MKFHKFDSLSFLAGIAITSVGLLFLVAPRYGDIVRLITRAGSWFWPAVLITIGVAVLAPLVTGRGSPGNGNDQTIDGRKAP